MKLVLFAIIALFSFSSQAQNVTPITMRSTWDVVQATGNTYDTLKGTTPVYLYSGNIPYANAVVIVATATETTGTTAGTGSLEVSQDGVSWAPYYNSMDSVYTQALSDVATPQVYRWYLKDFADKYVRVKWVAAGTVSVRVTAKYSLSIKR